MSRQNFTVKNVEPADIQRVVQQIVNDANTSQSPSLIELPDHEGIQMCWGLQLFSVQVCFDKTIMVRWNSMNGSHCRNFDSYTEDCKTLIKEILKSNFDQRHKLVKETDRKIYQQSQDIGKIVKELIQKP
jgi:hypothetical protein